MISLGTDYLSDDDPPRLAVERAAAGGYRLFHWCHEWNTDRLYSGEEMVAIRGWLDGCGCATGGVHGSCGPGRDWSSPAEEERAGGVELALNRLELARALGTDVVVMHLRDAAPDPVLRSLETLAPRARETGVRFALENLEWPTPLEQILERTPPELCGLCYDSGHGNITGEGLDLLARWPDRVIAVHLHDNDGHSDQHLIPGMGSLDWEAVTAALARTSYAGPVCLEIMIEECDLEMDEFLAQGRAAGERLVGMLPSTRRRRRQR